jgi:TRAP-type mannitol/chloroaromatic compound transport system permease small subunit
MKKLLKLATLIDALTEKVGSWVSFALLAAVLICAGNALIRYSFNTSSNAWLEIQWVLFSAVFLLGAAHTLRRNEHVRIDVITGRFSQRTQVVIDILGFVFFLLPMTCLILYYSLPYAWSSIQSQEVSSNAGGLIVWPAKCLIPLGFFLLCLQGLSELIKRFGYLTGNVDASIFEKKTSTPKEEIEAIKLANASLVAKAMQSETSSADINNEATK